MAFGNPVFFFGNSGKIVGHKFIGNTDTDLYAGYRGKMTLNDGLFIYPELIFQPLIFEDSDYYENRMSAVLWGMMRNRNRMGIYLNGNDLIKVKSLEKTINGNSQIPYIIVDARETTKVDSSTYRASGSIGPRQVVGMNNLRISLTNYSEIKYEIELGMFDYLTNLETESIPNVPTNFELYQNYPNPFNPSTTISWNLKTSGKVTLKIFDVTGKEVETILEEIQKAGFHSKLYIVNPKLSSGVYFYRLSTPNYSETKPMVILK